MAELRVLDGPNLYFTRPAVKLTLEVGGWLRAPEGRVAAVAAGTSMTGAEPHGRSGPRLRPGPPGSEHRQRFVARLAAHVAGTLAGATGTNLAVRARPGPGPDHIVVAFPWRHRGAAEALGREVARLFDAMPTGRRSFDQLLARSSESLEGAEPGPPPPVSDPSIPVIAVTRRMRCMARMASTSW